MFNFISLIFLSYLFVFVSALNPELEEFEYKARDFLYHVNQMVLEVSRTKTLATFNYETNVTDHNKQIWLEACNEDAKIRKRIRKTIEKDADWKSLRDPFVKGQFKIFTQSSLNLLSEKKFNKLNKLINDMKIVWEMENFTTCKNNSQETENCTFYTIDNESLMQKNDSKELANVWNNFTEPLGQKLKPMFTQYVNLINDAAKLNKFQNAGEMWLAKYEEKNFQKTLDDLWSKLKSFYIHLHGYIRHKLKDVYEEEVSIKGPIPVHLTRNIQGNQFGAIFDLIDPFPDGENIDFDQMLNEKEIEPKKFYELAEEFYKFLNFTELNPKFWEKSIFEESTTLDRKTLCDMSKTYNFFDGEDYRVKHCVSMNFKNLRESFKNLGEIYYDLETKNLPVIFQNSPNQALKESLGNALFLSVLSPDHMESLNFDFESKNTPEFEIRYLLKLSLDVLPSISFAYTVDSWRFDVFSGKIQETDYNCAWWDKVFQNQGLIPPESRSKTNFDAANIEIASNTPFLKTFLGTIAQYQIYEALCTKTDQFRKEDPRSKLYKCNFFDSSKVGNVLRDAMRQGNSKSWKDILKSLTGDIEFDPDSFLEYFKPLHLWLENEIEEKQIPIGWKNNDDYKPCF